MFAEIYLAAASSCTGMPRALSDAFSISRIGAEEVAELPLLNTARSLRETRSNIADEALALIGRHEPEEVAGLGVVVGIVAMVVAGNGSAYLFGPLDVVLVFSRSAEAIGFIVGRGSAVIVKAHEAVAVIGGEGTLRTIDGQRVVVNAQTILALSASCRW